MTQVAWPAGRGQSWMTAAMWLLHLLQLHRYTQPTMSIDDITHMSSVPLANWGLTTEYLILVIISYIRKEKYRPANTPAPMYVCHAQGTPPGF